MNARDGFMSPRDSRAYLLDRGPSPFMPRNRLGKVFPICPRPGGGRKYRQQSMPPMRLRSHLAILVAATVVPVIALAIVLVLRGHESNRASVERGMRETVHAMAFAVDRELAAAFGRLDLLARSPSIDVRDWTRFRDEAKEAQLDGGSWVVLTDLEGRQLVNTALQAGVVSPPRRELESFRRAIATRRPAVSNLVVAQVNGRHIVILNVAVLRAGTVRYVLSMTAPPSIVTQVLTAQRVPESWYAVIYDDNRTIIGRTRDEARALGQRAAGDPARETAADGFFRTVSREGQPIYFAYARVPGAPWRIGLGAPAEVIDGALQRSLWLALGGVVVATLVAALVAAVLGRRIATAIAGLATAAQAIGRGDDVVSEPSTITEVNAAATSLHSAALLLQSHKREREANEAIARRLAAIVQSSDDAIVGKTLDGVITSWNPGATRIFGYTEAEAVGQSILIIVPPDRHGEEAEVLRRLRAGEVIDHYETVRVAKDGRRIDVSLTSSPIRDASGRIVGASKIARDITERKRIEVERAALLAREQAARAEADAANRA